MKYQKLLKKSLATTLALAIGLTPFTPLGLLSGVHAASLTGGRLSLSDSRPSASSVSYDIEFDNVTTSTTRCILVEFDTDADGTGGKPTGLDITSASLSGSSDYIPTPASWTVTDDNTEGTLEITFATGETPANASDRNLILTGITNGSTAETGYYALFSTYANVDCTSSPIDTGITTFIYVTGQAVSLTVDPSLSFNVAAVANAQTVNGSTTTVTTTDGTIPFGTVTASANGIAAHDATVTTNAGSGYTVYIRYTAPPSSGSNEIDDHSGSNASPSTMSAGTEAFGYTTNDATLGTGTADRFTSAGGQKYAAFTTSNAEVAYSAAAVSSETTRIGYGVGISGTTPAGTYANSTVILTATPAY